jgi:peptidoglycan hydrolase CwlO-like protein
VPTQLKICLTVATAAAIAILFGSLAGAEGTDVERKLDSARSEATLITQRIESRSASIAALQSQADEAAARERELIVQLQASTARSSALNEDLLASERELEAVRGRYKRSVGVLADRLVAIYKSSEVDYLSVIVESDGFDDLETRSEYLEALTDADQGIADRVAALRDEVSANYDEIAGLKADLDEEAGKLEGARSEIERVRASAEARAAELVDAKAAEEAALRELQSKISGWELEVRKQAAEELGDGAYLGGPYSIPTYIVICESGGNYRALNASSGAGGAYQILPSTWRAYGGEGLPHLASKPEQDRIAAIIWREDGPGAWSCA